MAFDNPSGTGSRHSSETLRYGSDNETMKDWFENYMRETINDDQDSSNDWVGRNFDFEWVPETEDDPTGLKLTDKELYSSLGSYIHELCRALKRHDFTFVRVTDRRFRENKGDSALIITGHHMTGGELPEQILDDI